MSGEKRLTHSYDAQFRQQAARLVIVEGLSVHKAATDLGVPVNTLHGWVRKFNQGIWSLDNAASRPTKASAEATGGIRLPSSSQKQHDRMSDLERKNRELEIQVKRLTQEREILKKAMAYCLDVPK
jgi:transposase-like protein